MRAWAYLVSCALVFGGKSQGLAQQPTGPATLENLLTDEVVAPANPPVVVDATGPAAPAPFLGGRIQGTVVRPKDGVQHPDLDKAWVEYEAAVGKAAESVKAAISRQFDAAAAKENLDQAEKWQAILEQFEKAGEFPDSADTKAAVSAAVAVYTKAHEQLAKTYDATVKALTREKNIVEAKAVRAEWVDVVGNSDITVPGKVTIEIAARDFRDSRPANKATREAARWDGLTIPADDTLTWEVGLPKVGQYFIHIQYASDEIRPCDLVVNGTVVVRGALGERTGGFMGRNLKWATFGPVRLPQQNLVAIDPQSHGPHYRRIVISESKDAPRANRP